MKNEDYRPADIAFNVASDGTPMPENFGAFEKHEDVMKFLSDSKITTINQAITASRHMDFVEKRELKEQYNDILENTLPRLERDYTIRLSEFNEAKKKLSDASEMVNATITEVKILSMEVKRGVKDIKLDDLYTFRVPYKGRYYFYTWIDKQLKLCRIADIPEHEKTEIWNAMAYNEEFIDNHFAESNVQTEA